MNKDDANQLSYLILGVKIERQLVLCDYFTFWFIKLSQTMATFHISMNSCC